MHLNSPYSGFLDSGPMFFFRLSQITKDEGRSAAETIKHIYDHFAALGDTALTTKLKELAGK